MKTAYLIRKTIFGSSVLLFFASVAVSVIFYLGAMIAAPAGIVISPESYALPAALFFIFPIAITSIPARALYLSPLRRLALSPSDTGSRRPHAAAEETASMRKRLYRLSVFTFLLNAVVFTPAAAALSLRVGFTPGPAAAGTIVYAVLGLCASLLLSSAQTHLDFRFLAPAFRALNDGGADDRQKKKVKFGIRFNLNLAVTAALAFCLVFSINIAFSLRRAARYQASLVEATAQGKLAPAEALERSLNPPYRPPEGPANDAEGVFFAAGLLLFVSALASIFPVTADLRRRVIRQRSLLENILLGNDFTNKRDIVIQRDEIGLTSATLNTFIDRFAELLHTIFSSADSVQSVSGALDTSLDNASVAIEEMVTAIKQITANAEKQMRMVKNTSSKLEEMLVGIDGTSIDVVELSNFVTETSSAMHETTASMETISKNTNQVNELANKLVEIAQNGSVAVNETVNAIREIAKASRQVSNIVDIISGIAEQTNLLSLNASIEAAHAGDRGKGFAVVADEIRKLAEQSNENIALIAKQVENMNQRVKAGVDLGSSADEAFRKIYEDIKLTTQHINQVTIALQEQNQGTREIMTALEEMVKKTVEVKEIAVDLKRMSEEAHRFMGELLNITSYINDATGEQDKGNKEILSLITTVKNASQRNLSVVDSLQTVVKTFHRRKATGADPALEKAAAGA